MLRCIRVQCCTVLRPSLTLFCSSSASANSFLMLASDSPTYLLRISGPLTIFGSRALSILPICRAIRVLPQPGGPYSRIPFTCLQPGDRRTTRGRGGGVDVKQSTGCSLSQQGTHMQPMFLQVVKPKSFSARAQTEDF